MKVVHFSGAGPRTGGGLAAARIHGALLARGIDSELWCSEAEPGMPKCFAAPRPTLLRLGEKMARPLERRLLSRLGAGCDAPQSGLLGRNIAAIARQRRADIVHLHWLGGGSFRTASLADVRAPVVWRLPDMSAFCAVEMYEPDRRAYAEGPAPRHGAGQWTDIRRIAWRNKMRTYARIESLTVACPSRWLLAEARRSAAFGGRPIELVATGCDTALFSPRSRSDCRAALGLPQHVPIVLAGADQLGAPRKGMDLLADALRELASRWPNEPQHRPLVASFGGGALPQAISQGLPYRSFGVVHERERLAMLYAAADVLVAPSRMENLANTVLEAMACGTPAVAFDIGGMPDVIEHGRSGYLAARFDVGKLADGIAWAIEQRGDESVRRAARARIEAGFTIGREADAYLAIYRRMLGTGNERSAQRAG